MNEQDTLHRHDEGGPTATIECNDLVATATWSIPEGKLLKDHPELNTGGYVYFTPDSDPIDVVKESEGGEAKDFSGAVFGPSGGLETITLHTEDGVLYRAHILLAYEDGPAWHNDTRFVCETVQTDAPIEVLPYTGADDFIGWIVAAGLLITIGWLMLRRKS